MRIQVLNGFFDELEKISALGEAVLGGGRAAIMARAKNVGRSMVSPNATGLLGDKSPWDKLHRAGVLSKPPAMVKKSPVPAMTPAAMQVGAKYPASGIRGAPRA